MTLKAVFAYYKLPNVLVNAYNGYSADLISKPLSTSTTVESNLQVT